MAEAEHPYHHGDMDIHAQEQTFRGFISGAKWGSLAVASMLVLLVFWFCTPIGFFGGLVTALIIVALGVFFLRSKPVAH